MADINMTAEQVAARILSIGDKSNLKTTAKNDLVAAVNEINARVLGTGVQMRVSDFQLQYSVDGGAYWNNLISTTNIIPTENKLSQNSENAPKTSAVFSALGGGVDVTAEYLASGKTEREFVAELPNGLYQIADGDGGSVYLKVSYGTKEYQIHVVFDGDIFSASVSAEGTEIAQIDSETRALVFNGFNTLLPAVSEEDNGKILKVVNGAWQAVAE